MFIRKSKIARVIQKERLKERRLMEKKSARYYQGKIRDIEERHQTALEKMEQDHRKQLLDKDKEIKKLKKEIENNHSTYLEIRKRERHLDSLTSEVEDEVERAILRVQESIQPIYRTRAKIDSIRRKSDRKNEKVETIFKAVK